VAPKQKRAARSRKTARPEGWAVAFLRYYCNADPPGPGKAAIGVPSVRFAEIRLFLNDCKTPTPVAHEALAALSARFGVLVRNSAALDQPLSGTYQGSLQQVVARLLAGRDYVATYAPGNAEIKILGPGLTNSGKSQPVAAPPVVAAPVVAAPASAANPTVDKGKLMFVPR
jgi:hypothetical protein